MNISLRFQKCGNADGYTQYERPNFHVDTFTLKAPFFDGLYWCVTLFWAFFSAKKNAQCRREYHFLEKQTKNLIVDEVDIISAPFVYILPYQLFAYHTALLKGTDVDQPRNLAKSVTVE